MLQRVKGLDRAWLEENRGVEANDGSNTMPSPHIKDEEMYQRLRADGASEEKAARIANAAARDGRAAVGRRGGEAGSYDDWTVAELRSRAKELGHTGYSHLKKAELISMLRRG